MSRSVRNSRVLVVLVLAALAVGSSAGSAVAATGSSSGSGSDVSGSENNGHTGPGFHVHQNAYGEADVNVCSYDTPPGVAHCNARVRTDTFAQQLGNALNAHGVTPNALTPSVTNPGSGAYGPADLQAAYNAPSANGAGLTVAIVDAFNDPNAESDLAAYRSAFGLPACTTANGCFRKVNQAGGTTYPTSDAGWSQEISLDVDMVSAMCPLCHILLVEATDNSFPNLGAAVNYAASVGAIAISNSYGGGEWSGETSADSSYFNHPGVAVTASSGDSGYGVEYPAASHNVVAVGGTSLQKTNGVFTETAWGQYDSFTKKWSGAGSGCSAFESKPIWQLDTGCAKRTVTDVSAIADPQTGVWAYDTYGFGGWLIFGGTSVASPIIASVYALAGGPWPNQPASYPYSHTGSLHDVVSGSNGSCGGTYLCTAVSGYDGPTGLGTPNTAAAFVAGSTTQDFSVSASPQSLALNPNAIGSSLITLAAQGGYTGTVSLSASVTTGDPSGLDLTLPASASVPSTPTLGVTANSLLGSYTVTVTADDGSVQHSATVNVTVSTVPKVNQTITFGTLANRTMVQSPFTVSATASSGLPVSFSTTTPSVCTSSGTNGQTITLVAAGTCTVQADQAGNDTYAVAPSVSRSFMVSRLSQTITFGFLSSRTMVQSPFTVSATASSGLPVSFSTTTPSVCTSGGTNGATITLVTGGTCTITAAQAGTAVYNPAASVSRSFSVSKSNQTITFGTLANRTIVQSPFTVSATASSGLTVSFSSTTPLVCTSGGTNGATITLVKTGTCTVKATQTGNATYNAAAIVSRSFTVSKVSQTITFGAVANRTIVQSPLTVSATASSGLAVSFSATTPLVCTSGGTNGATITLVKTGTCTVRAVQAGNATYNAAASVSRSFTVSKVSQTITFGALPNASRVQSPFTVSATTSSGLAVSFSSTTTFVCTSSGTNGTMITLLRTGTCTVKATQTGNATYNAAASVSQSFTVS